MLAVKMWLLLIILGLITYFIIKRSVATITKTPVWLIWLVMMTPGFIFTVWFLVFGENKPIPPLLLIGTFILCPLLYWWLIQRGRLTEKVSQNVADSQPTLQPQEGEGASKLRPITTTEEKSLRDCFPWGVYYLQHLDYQPQAILCRGKLRTAAEVAYQTIKDNVEQVFGDRFLVLFQESYSGQPFFALVANPWQKKESQPKSELLTRPWLALGLLLLTIVTTTLVGAAFNYNLPMSKFFDQLEGNPSLWLSGVPYSCGIIAILGIHELSHYFTAIHYKIRTTLPYFIPFPDFLGTFGAFIQMRSPVPHRQALFDVAIAGPLGGLIITIPLLIWGLSLSEIVPLAEKSSLLNFHALNPRLFFLFALFGKLSLGNALMPGTAISLHPLAIAGYIGLIVTALNLMPVGQLDGGHIVHAMFGQRMAMIVGQLTRLLMLIRAFAQPEFLLWAIILFLMPVADQPALNDVSELDNRRDVLGLFSLALLLMILLPLPKVVAQWLNL